MTTPEAAERVRNAPDAALAKKLAKSLPRRDDWDVIKNMVMHECCLVKFSSEPFRRLLLSTGEAELIEGNHWGDRYWGVCRGVGDNHLGRILMRIRHDLRTQ